MPQCLFRVKGDIKNMSETSHTFCVIAFDTCKPCTGDPISADPSLGLVAPFDRQERYCITTMPGIMVRELMQKANKWTNKCSLSGCKDPFDVKVTKGGYQLCKDGVMQILQRHAA